MKICFVVEFYPPHLGGGEISAQKLIEGLSHEGEDCIVVTTRTEPNLPPVEEKRNLRIFRIWVPSFAKRLCFTILAVPRILCVAKDCDLIQGATYGGALPSILAAKLLRKKSLLVIHEFMGGLWKNLERNLITSSFYQTVEKIITVLPFDKFIAVSRYTRNCLRFLGVSDHKLEFVYWGENTEIFETSKTSESIRKELGFSPEDFIFLTFGRAGITKGIEFFVAAIPLIYQQIPNAKFILILTKDRKKIWNSIMDTLKNLPKNIFHLSCGVPREELSGYLQVSDCIVIPSLSEGFGFTALEACSLGKKVVATDAGALPEVVFGNCVLVKPRSVQDLVEGCIRASKENLEFVPPKNFQWTRTIRQYQKIYRKVLDQ